MASVSQSSQAERPVRSSARPESVIDSTVCRPSAGSGAPTTCPAALRGITVSPIDCERTPSALASAVTVAGP